MTLHTEALGLRDSIHVTPQCRSVIRRLLEENAALREAASLNTAQSADPKAFLGFVPSPEWEWDGSGWIKTPDYARAALKSGAA